jgi:outer membrane immunogenic protein
MQHSHRSYLVSTVAALAIALPTAGFAGGKMGAVAEPVVIAPAPAPAPAPVAEWTGFYGGLGVAYGRGVSNTEISSVTLSGDPVVFSPSVTGFLGTARLGYDIQQGNFVFGALIEGSLGKISGTDTTVITLGSTASTDECTIGSAVFCPSTAVQGDTITLSAKASYSNLMSVALRGGGLVNDGNTLLYGRLGMSRAKLTATLPGTLGSVSTTGTGFNAGLGVEHRLNRNISIFAEYNYHDVGKTFTTNVAGEDWTVSGKGLHTIGAGVNFRF